MTMKSEKLPADKLLTCFADATNSCVKVLDPTGMILSFNKSGLQMMEIPNRKLVIGRDWWELWPEDFQDSIKDFVNTAVTTKQPVFFEGACPTYAGREKYWNVDIVPLHNNFDEVQWLLVTTKDATELYNFRQKYGAGDSSVISF